MNGVTPVVFRAEVTVGFYPDNVCCDGCRILTDDTQCRGRKICFLTQEIIHYPKQRGLRCPLEAKEDNDA